jgi:hypothetical protein
VDNQARIDTAIITENHDNLEADCCRVLRRKADFSISWLLNGGRTDGGLKNSQNSSTYYLAKSWFNLPQAGVAEA